MWWTILFISEPFGHSCIAVIQIAAIRNDDIKYLPNTQIHSGYILTICIRYSYIHTNISTYIYMNFDQKKGETHIHTTSMAENLLIFILSWDCRTFSRFESRFFFHEAWVSGVILRCIYQSCVYKSGFIKFS